MRNVAALVLIVLGLSCIGWYGLSAGEAASFQRQQNAALERALERGPAGIGAAVHVPPRRMAAHALVGRLEIPRVGLSTVVVEGDDDATLKVSAGHLPDTALPWQGGNMAIAGHRDTFFRPLKDVRRGDEIVLTTTVGKFRYRVRETAIARPEDIDVLRPTRRTELTLLTCYPFYYVGSAPKRYIVKAERLK